MATSFTSQLAQIAAKSSHELDLRARKTAHSASLLFPRDVAASQDWTTIYTICHEGFREICLLDSAFAQYERNLFSAQSREQDREQMNQKENEALDNVLGRCLRMLAARLVLSPGLRCLEWLVRRFQVHIYNTKELMLAVLPLHAAPVWRNVLSIVPQKNLVGEWKFVMPYHREAQNVPRHTVVYAAAHNDEFFAALNQHVLFTCREGAGDPGLLRFWCSVITEAVAGRLNAARSGIKEVQRQRVEEVLLKVLPVLSDGFETKTYPELTTGCFTLTMILAAKADLDDRVLDSLIQAVAGAADTQGIDVQTVIVTMLVIVEQKQARVMPKAGVDLCSGMPGLTEILKTLGASYAVDVLVEALVNGALLSMKRRNVTTRLKLVNTLLHFSGTEGRPTAFENSIQSILQRVALLDSADPNQNSMRARLIDTLRDVNEDSKLGSLIASVTSRSETDREQFESLIGSTIALVEAPPKEEDAMEIDPVEPTQQSLQRHLVEIPTQTKVRSFLAGHDEELFQRLVKCFQLSCQQPSDLAAFSSLPLWSSSFSLYLTFLTRVSLGDYVTPLRSSALTLISRGIADTNFDLQALLPYVLVALGDQATQVRQAAGDLLVAIESVTKSVVQSSTPEKFGGLGLYSSENDEQLAWISTSHLSDIISQACLTSLEECVLDATRVFSVVQNALNGPSQTQAGVKTATIDLKKSVRHSIFELLTTHAVATPLYRLKMDIINLLGSISKVGASSKSKALAPILESWIDLNEADAHAIVQAEGLQHIQTDSVIMQLITSQDKEGIGRILSTFEHPTMTVRSNLVTAFFDRIQKVWGEIKHDIQLPSALRIFELSFATNQAVQAASQNFLQNINLSTHVLGGILEQSIGGLAQIQTEDQQPRKRRRVSHGRRDSLPNHMISAIETATSRLTLALELVDNAQPETRPELMPLLFDLLAIFKRLRGQQRLESPYLLNLCLSSILAIIDRQRTLSKPTIDMSSVRAELVTDCVRPSENPQVQNTALLLSASLSTIAPDQILHNLMPIFAFMGQNMFSKEDEYSVHVINQAIDQIVPALVNSLRKRKQNILKSISGLLASFVAAFDHIPQQQRVTLYQRLLLRMGVSDYAFILITMLVLRKKDRQAVITFVNALLDGFSAAEQLETYEKLIDLAVEATKRDSRFAEDVLGFEKTTSNEEMYRCSKTVFGIALQLLNSKTLKPQTTRMYRMEENKATALRAIFTRCIPQLLQAIKSRKSAGHESELAKQCMDALLELPSPAELFNLTDTISSSLDTEPDLNAQILRVIASKLDGHAPRDNKTRNAALEVLSRLTDSITQATPNVQVKQAMIVCIDKISEAYGRKDPDRVLQAAQAVCGELCLALPETTENRRTKLMSLLCLASLAEMLKEACAPIVPGLMVQVVGMLATNVQQGRDEGIHNAIYTLISSIVSHVPYLISDDILSEILVLSSRSAHAYASKPAVESRAEALLVVGSKLDISTLVTTLAGDDLDISREYPDSAELEKLDLLSTSIDAASKADVVRNADSISQLILAHLDQRRRLTENVDDATPASVGPLEDKINQVSIKVIYKLNDTVFRPIFETWIDWATKCPGLASTSSSDDAATKLHRQTSLFNLLNHFFSTLKSIVTSYASYIIQPASTILTETASLATTTKSLHLSTSHQTLYTTLLTTLQSALLHDADTFFSSPTHFTPLASPLISQLTLASSKHTRPLVSTHIIPTILHLATATIDTPAHHQTLCLALTSLRHNPSSPIRLASIRTLAALTTADNLGDDWLANTVGVGSTSALATHNDAQGIARGGGSSAGQVMIYVNEMLEDEDEGVEMETRKWVQRVREMVGEDVFEV